MKRSEEVHKDGGKPYRMAVKWDRKKRWLHMRNYAHKKHVVKLNFSSVHSSYYSAREYTTKEDNDYLQSQDHPDSRNNTLQLKTPVTFRKGNKKKKGWGIAISENTSHVHRFSMFRK